MITFHISGINKAMQELRAYAASLPVKMRVLVQLLMDEGWEIANAGFASALRSGINDVEVVRPYWEGNTMYLVAEGEYVAFIEFGTGTYYPDYPGKLPDGIVPHGEYGLGLGKDPPWIYVGEAGNHGAVLRKGKNGKADVVMTNGDPPARAMYDASKVLDRDHIEQVAREVFNGRY